MSYDTVKDGIAGILKLQGYIESEDMNDFKNVSAQEYGNTFILNCVSGEANEPDTETMVARFFDQQLWRVQIALENSAQTSAANYDEAHRKKDILLRELDDPTNWSSYVRIQKYRNWSIEKTDNYFVLIIELKVIDTYTY